MAQEIEQQDGEQALENSNETEAFDAATTGEQGEYPLGAEAGVEAVDVPA